MSVATYFLSSNGRLELPRRTKLLVGVGHVVATHLKNVLERDVVMRNSSPLLIFRFFIRDH
jgi:hypothetical protein